MRVRLKYLDTSKDNWVVIPETVMKMLGWESGDELIMDVPMTQEGSLLLYKDDNGSNTNPNRD